MAAKGNSPNNEVTSVDASVDASVDVASHLGHSSSTAESTVKSTFSTAFSAARPKLNPKKHSQTDKLDDKKVKLDDEKVRYASSVDMSARLSPSPEQNASTVYRDSLGRVPNAYKFPKMKPGKSLPKPDYR